MALERAAGVRLGSALSLALERAAPVVVAMVMLVGCGQSGAASDAGSFTVSASQGYVAVQLRKCGDCHQSFDPSDGVLSGQSRPAKGTQSYGSNLTPDPDTGMDAWDAGSIVTAILSGANDQGHPLCPPMPLWADAGMTVDEALAIAAYLQTLTPVRHVVPASTCASITPAPDAGR
jgi:hypothetical protein